MKQELSHDAVKDYYGTVLKGSEDLKTNACCCVDEQLAPSVKAAMARVNDEVIRRFYGCGSPIPPALEGCTVLDLGCGTGRDVFVAAQLVGPQGHVIGVDMTEDQLDVARRNVDSQMTRFGFDRVNVDFRQGYMEDLKSLDLADESVDVVISNCVINLSPDKQSVFNDAFRVLKSGGRLAVSDVVAVKPLPDSLRNDSGAYCSCVGGAALVSDIEHMLRDAGFSDVRVDIKQESAEIINGWEQSRGYADFVRSAFISAVKK